MVKDYRAQASEVELLECSVNLLPDKQGDVIRCIYFEGMKWVDVCDRLFVSKTEVGRLRKKAVNEIIQLLHGADYRRCEMA